MKHSPINKNVPPKKYTPSNATPTKHRSKTPPRPANVPFKKHPPSNTTPNKHRSKTPPQPSNNKKVQQKQQQQQYRDPFEIFDSVMKVDYGDNYKK